MGVEDVKIDQSGMLVGASVISLLLKLLVKISRAQDYFPTLNGLSVVRGENQR